MEDDIVILIASPVWPGAVAALRREHTVTLGADLSKEEFARAVAHADILVLRSGVTLDAPLLRSAANLKLIVRAGSGLDNIDLDVVEERGIIFERIPRPGARAVAELTFAMMLSLARNLATADRLWREGRWVKHEIEGYLLNRKRLGVVGAGNIGSEVGRLGALWGMDVVGCVEDPTPEIAAALARNNIRLAEFAEVVTTSDFVSIHVPLTSATRGLFNDAVLRSMKPGSYLLNLARGGVVDERALCAVLKEGGGIAGAGLDVHESEGNGNISPLASFPNVILTPHIGAQTVDSQREIGEVIVGIVERFVRHRVPVPATRLGIAR